MQLRKFFGCTTFLIVICSQNYAQTTPIGFAKAKEPVSNTVTKSDTTLFIKDPASGVSSPKKYVLNNPSKPYKIKESRINSTNKFAAKKYEIYVKKANRLLRRSDTIMQVAMSKFDEATTVNYMSDIKGKAVYDSKEKAANDDLNNAKKEASAFKNAAREAYYTAKNSGQLNLFPVANSTDAQMYYNGTISDSKAKFLSNSLISFGSDGGKASIFNEIYADFYGPVRVGFGALISNNQSTATNATPAAPATAETQKDAVQRLLGGGGNAVFNASVPLLNYQSESDLFFIKFLAAPKIGIDVPKLGTQNNMYSFNWEPGFEGTIFYSGALNVLTFYSNFRFSWVGGNGSFYDNLAKADNKAFMFNQISAGFAINSTFRLGYNIYYGSSFARANFPATISFNIIPN